MALTSTGVASSAGLGGLDQAHTGKTRSALPLIGALVLGIILSGVVAATAAEAGPIFVVPLILMVPALVLLSRYPFAAVLIWFLLFQWVARGTTGCLPILQWGPSPHESQRCPDLANQVMGGWSETRRRTFLASRNSSWSCRCCGHCPAS